VSYLVDTNVLSELARPAPNPNVIAWAATLDAFALSAVTVEEIFYGLAARPSPRILAWFESFVSRRCRVLDVTAPIARQAGQLRGALSLRGRARTQADMLIAATAAHHGLTLATRNERDFHDCGIAVLNPFDRASGSAAR
jgi:predicted nucleic acid-binding protein